MYQLSDVLVCLLHLVRCAVCLKLAFLMASSGDVPRAIIELIKAVAHGYRAWSARNALKIAGVSLSRRCALFVKKLPRKLSLFRRGCRKRCPRTREGGKNR